MFWEVFMLSRKRLLLVLLSLAAAVGVAAVIYVYPLPSKLTAEMNSEEKYNYTEEELIKKGYVIEYLVERKEENKMIINRFIQKVEANQPAVINIIPRTLDGPRVFSHIYYNGESYHVLFASKAGAVERKIEDTCKQMKYNKAKQHFTLSDCKYNDDYDI